MNRHTAPFDGNFDAIDEAHTDFFGRCPGLGETAEVIMVGQRPEIDPVTGGAPSYHLRRQKTVGNDGVAMKIEIGWRHG
jgi:hypothetical protein